MKTRAKQAMPMEQQMVLRSRKPSNPKNKKTKTKKKITKDDPSKPKKPPTAFFYYLEDFRKIYQEENPNIKSMREIGKACGKKWKTLPFEEKVQYYDVATQKRAEFEKAMAAYLKRKESSEESGESDENDEFG